MSTVEASRAIQIHQDAGPDLNVIAGLVPYYTEVLSAIAVTDIPKIQYVAAAAFYGANINQPEFNEPVDKAVSVARGLAEADMAIASGSLMPVMGLSHFSWQAGLTKPSSRLLVVQNQRAQERVSVETDSATPVIRGDKFNRKDGNLLSAGGVSYREGDPERKFAIDPPAFIFTDNYPPSDDVLARAVWGTSREMHNEGILAVGKDTVGRLLGVMVRHELGDQPKDLEGFSESKALLALSYFREHGSQLAPSSSSSLVREAGRRAVSALIAGTAQPLIDSRHDARTITGPIVQRLGAIDFTREDLQPIMDGVYENMDHDGSKKYFASLARMNGVTLTGHVLKQTLDVMSDLLGVPV